MLDWLGGVRVAALVHICCVSTLALQIDLGFVYFFGRFWRLNRLLVFLLRCIGAALAYSVSEHTVVEGGPVDGDGTWAWLLDGLAGSVERSNVPVDVPEVLVEGPRPLLVLVLGWPKTGYLCLQGRHHHVVGIGLLVAEAAPARLL